MSAINPNNPIYFFKYDSKDAHHKPRRYREALFHGSHGVSGSAQFSKSSLSFLSQHFQDKSVVVLDAREETHLHDQEGKAVSIRGDQNDLNKGKTLHHILSVETQFVEQTKQGRTFEMYSGQIESEEADIEPQAETNNSTNECATKIHKLTTEEHLLKEVTPHYTYHRLPITDGHLAHDHIIDQVIDIKHEAKKAGKWIHVHCCQGKGRTSTLLTLIYIIEHAKTKTLDEIFDHLESLGNINLRKASARKSEELNRRSDPRFWNLFHKFCSESHHESKKWSVWRSEQPETEAPQPKPVKIKKTAVSETVEKELQEHSESIEVHQLSVKNGVMSTSKLGQLQSDTYMLYVSSGSLYITAQDLAKPKFEQQPASYKIKVDGTDLCNIIFKNAITDEGEKERQKELLEALRTQGVNISETIVRVNPGNGEKEKKLTALKWLAELSVVPQRSR